jgi:FkbM family methyltransferase
MQQTPLGFRFTGHEGMEAGTFEQLESKLIRSYSAPSTVFVDVGANFGYFTCLDLELMYKNLEANGFRDVEIFPVGLGSEPGMATLYGGGTSASLLTRWAGTSEVWKRTIPLSTLDVILGDRFAGQPMMVKIDVEGMEHTVLAGAQRTLARRPSPRWLVEICLTAGHPQGCNPHYADVFRAFWDHGYTARSVENDPREVTPADVERWVAQGRRDRGDTNFLFDREP